MMEATIAARSRPSKCRPPLNRRFQQGGLERLAYTPCTDAPAGLACLPRLGLISRRCQGRNDSLGELNDDVRHEIHQRLHQSQLA
jgi:hypothetical protein